MRRSWTDPDEEPIKDFPNDDEILFASYGGASYEGDAFVLFERAGKLYENTGGHCSCYGLEGQWEPEETTWDALVMRKLAVTAEDYGEGWLHDHSQEALDFMRALLMRRVGAAV
jgi:hypothetical protein